MNATLITPGAWTDMASRSEINYTPRELQTASTRWLKNTLNLDHEWKVLNTIGTIQSPHWEDNAVKANLYINTVTSAGKDTVALIDAGLVNALSVELQSLDRRDTETNKLFATDIDFIGCAVIYGDLGACADAHIR
jgi:hypothetical protein